MDSSRPSDRHPPRRRPLRVAILFNVDFADRPADDDPGHAARADVAEVAAEVERALRGAHEPLLLPVDGDLQKLRERLADVEPDCVFNLCESLAGDARLESAVPLLLDLLGVPYTGAPPEAVSRALYKDRVKRLLEAAGVPTPPSCVMTSPDDPCDCAFPLIVKPTREDGSVGITAASVVHDRASLRARVAEVTGRLHQPCLVEQFVDGRELNVALLGYPTARVLPLSEIDFTALPPDAPRVVTYDAKWSAGSVEDLGTRPVLSPDLAPALAARVRRVAGDAFRVLGARDYGRVDVRLARSGVPYVIDVNPNCDLSPGAGMARAAAAVGIDYPALVRLVVRYAMRRRRARARDVARMRA